MWYLWASSSDISDANVVWPNSMVLFFSCCQAVQQSLGMPVYLNPPEVPDWTACSPAVAAAPSTAGMSRYVVHCGPNICPSHSQQRMSPSHNLCPPSVLLHSQGIPNWLAGVPGRTWNSKQSKYTLIHVYNFSAVMNFLLCQQLASDWLSCNPSPHCAQKQLMQGCPRTQT